jgi:indolepyruvate ferredoxin oxidoreductase
MSVEPLDTELGRKRRINQSTCNKDELCAEGFCPSFVTVLGAKPLRGVALAERPEGWPELPEPTLPALGDHAYGILVTGIGGTGVVTIGSILGTAAHLDGKAASVLDVTGLAQKYGAVMSHLRVARDPALLQSTRLAAREADLVVGCDLVVTAGAETLSKMDARRTKAVVNTELTPTSDFTRNPDWHLDERDLQDRVRGAANGADCVAVTRIATRLMGDAIAVNMFMVGYAWQKGWLPVTRDAIERAIALNDVAVAFNQACFAWGRRYAHDPASVERLLQPAEVVALPAAPLRDLGEILAHRGGLLTEYQDAAYAERHRALVERVARREREVRGDGRLAVAVARSYFKLLAHKDEYEVARLYASPEFRAELARTFEGDLRLRFHLGAGPFARTDPATGQPLKTEVGGWVMAGFRILARLKRLRGTWLDPFRRTPERRLATHLVAEYEADVERLVRELDPARHDLAVAIAGWPESVRGYAHVRAESAAKTQQDKTQLWKQWESDGKQRNLAVHATSA